MSRFFRPSLRVRFLLAVGWTLAIVVALTLPPGDIPNVPVLGIDKVVHLALFAVLGWLWMSGTDLPPARRHLWVLTAGLVFAAGSEVYQGLLPFGRQPDVADALFDAVGLILGVAAWRAAARRGLVTGTARR